MRSVVNTAFDPTGVPAPSDEAAAFHRRLPAYTPTPLHELTDIAKELGVGAVLVKDESHRLGLPAFKILGASWAVERSLRERPHIHTLVAASAGTTAARSPAPRRCAGWRPGSTSPPGRWPLGETRSRQRAPTW